MKPFLKQKKTKKKGEIRPDATVVPRRRDQWQLNAHRLDSLNYVTTRSNGLESLQSRTRSSMHVTVETRFSQEREFLKKIQMIIFEQNHPSYFCSKFFHPSKSSLGFFLGQNLPRKSFFWKKKKTMGLEKLKKLKTEQKRRKTETNTTSATKKKDNWQIEKSSSPKEKGREKSTGDKRIFLEKTFFEKKIEKKFSNEITSKRW